MNTGKSVSYKASAVASSSSTDLEKRIPILIPIVIGVVAIFSGTASAVVLSQEDAYQHVNTKYLPATFAEAGMEAATDHFLEWCGYFNDQKLDVLPADQQNYGIAFVTSSSGKTGEVVNISADQADNYSNTCELNGELRYPFFIYAKDTLDLKELQALLESFPDANLKEQVSINGHGILFWSANLTLKEVLEVWAESQVYSFLCLFFASKNVADHLRLWIYKQPAPLIALAEKNSLLAKDTIPALAGLWNRKHLQKSKSVTLGSRPVLITTPMLVWHQCRLKIRLELMTMCMTQVPEKG